MTRRGYVDETSRTVFFWSQKCACTTLFRTLRRTYGHDNRYYHDGSLAWQRCLPYIQDANYRSFAIVRNPFARAVSCYINKFVRDSKGCFQSRSDIVSSGGNLYKKYRKLSGNTSDANTLTFREFLTTIEALFAERGDADLNTVDGHWDTQIPPGLVGRGFSYDYRIDASELNSRFPEVCDQLGLRYVKEKTNATDYSTDGAGDGLLVDRPAYELVDLRLHADSFLTPDICDTIRRMYKPGFEFLGYDSTVQPE